MQFLIYLILALFTTTIGSLTGIGDGPLIRYAFRNKNVCSLTAKDILAKTPWKYLSKNLDCIPVERFSASTKWLHDCAEKIKEGKSVIIFPEGTTLKSQEISNFQSGFLLLAKTANVEVLPVVIYRTFGLHWKPPKIKIGVPYTITDKKLTKSVRQQETLRFQQILTQLYCDLTGKTAKEATKEQPHNYTIFNKNK